MILKLLKYYLSLFYWERASVDAVKRMQLRKFRQVFEYAREHSKFYKDLYTKHGVMDLKIEKWEDIDKVPVITKAMLREYSTSDIMTCEIHKNINIHSTSGSTGEPFKIAYTKYEDYTSHVRLTREIMKHGYTPFKKMALLSRYEPGHNFEVEDDIGLISKIQKKINIFPKKVISIFEPIESVIKQLEEYKPFIIWSTPSYIHLLALELKRQNKDLKVPLCFLMAETISPEQMKLFRERVCKNVIDAYGCMESPSMGYSINTTDCKNLVVSTTLVEVINQRKVNDKEVGDIIVTSLINKTMPFIRYELGDYVGIIDDESFPTKKIGKVYGRFEDILSLDDNKTLSFHQTYQMFHDFHEVEQYKFIQLLNDDIVLQLKTKKGTDQEDVKKKALSIWNKYFPKSILLIEFVEEFEISKKTGKFKVIEKKK